MSKRIFHPSVIETITFGSKQKATIADAKRLLNYQAKVMDEHLFVEFHGDYQHERKVKYFENCKHFHIPVAREYPNPTNRDLFTIKATVGDVLSAKMDVRIDVKPYVRSVKETMYFLVGHEEYGGKWVACPRHSKCRRRGCWFRKNMDEWSLARGDWKE